MGQVSNGGIKKSALRVDKLCLTIYEESTTKMIRDLQRIAPSLERIRTLGYHHLVRYVLWDPLAEVCGFGEKVEGFGSDTNDSESVGS